MYREAKFYIIENKKEINKNLKNFVKYNSGWLVDKGYAAGVSLMFQSGYIGFDVNAETGDVCGFGGFCAFSTILKADLGIPANFKKGLLKLIVPGVEELQCGKTLRMSCEPTMRIDEKNRIIEFGKFDNEKPAYKFLGNAFVQLDDSGNLLGIVLTDI